MYLPRGYLQYTSERKREHKDFNYWSGNREEDLTCIRCAGMVPAQRQDQALHVYQGYPLGPGRGRCPWDNLIPGSEKSLSYAS